MTRINVLLSENGFHAATERAITINLNDMPTGGFREHRVERLAQ